MRVARRTIPYINKHVFTTIKALVSIGKPATAIEIFDHIKTTGSDHDSGVIASAIVDLRKQGYLVRQGKANCMSLYALTNYKKTAELVEVLSKTNYGFTQPENTQLNRAVKFIERWSSMDNKPVSVVAKDREWRVMCMTVSSSKVLRGVENFLEHLDVNLWKVKDSFFEQFKLWLAATEIVRSILGGNPPKIVGEAPRPNMGAIVYLSSVTTSLLQCMLLVGDTTATKLYSGNTVDRFEALKELPYENFMTRFANLRKLGLTEKFGADRYSPYRLKDPELTQLLLDKIKSCNMYGIEQEENTALKAASVFLNLSAKEDKTPEECINLDKAVTSLVNLQFRTGINVIERLGVNGTGEYTVHIPDWLKGYTSVWEEITQVVETIKNKHCI